MIVQYLDAAIMSFFPRFIISLGALEIAPGVSLLGFWVACMLFTIIMGAIILRAGG